jgi:UDP-glucose:(heptosyl)LPS alpha-1,3-glucosyltransferase
LHVVFLKSNILKRGGLEKYTLRLARGFAASGHQVTLLTTDYKEGAIADSTFTVVSLGNKSSFSLLQLLRFDFGCKKYVKQHKPDIVFGMERNFCPQTHYRAGNGCQAAYLDRRKKTDFWLKCLSFSINPLHRLILAMEKSTYESPNLQRLFVNSYMVQKEVLAYYPTINPSKISVVHNGVEWHELQKTFDESLQLRPQIMKNLGLDPGVFQFLFVGNEYGRKGLYDLLQALYLIKDKKFHLTIVGKERNPEPFIVKVAELGLASHVHFAGAVVDMKPFYSACDCLVIPSLYDPFANVTVEALAMGLQVVSSTHNGGSEVIITPEQGCVFSEPQELARCLRKALLTPKTPASASIIRQSVAYLDFSNQIGKIIQSS